MLAQILDRNCLPKLQPKACCILLALSFQGRIRYFLLLKCWSHIQSLHTIPVYWWPCRLEGEITAPFLLWVAVLWTLPQRVVPTNSSEGFPWPADFIYNFYFETTCQTPSFGIKYNCFQGPRALGLFLFSQQSHIKATQVDDFSHLPRVLEESYLWHHNL